MSAQYGEPPPPPLPPGSPLTEEPPAECPKPLPRPSSKPAAEWLNRGTALLISMLRTTSSPGSDELLAPLLVRSETRMPDAYAPAPCDASGNLAQSAPTAKVRRIDAEVRTEPLPILVDASAQARPVLPDHAMAMPGFPCTDSAMSWYSCEMVWYNAEEGQDDLIRYLFRRGSAIPARPLFDRDAGRPVLRLALKTTRRYAVPETRARRGA